MDAFADGRLDVTARGAAFALADAASGTRVRITATADGHLERRLLELGLPRGSEVTVVRRLGRRNAPLVVAAFGTRVAIGAGMARDIQVVHAPDTL